MEWRCHSSFAGKEFFMRYIIKRIITLALCICLMFSLTACGQEDESEISELSAETSQEEKKQDDKESEEAVKNLEKMKDTSDKVKNVSMELFKESVSDGKNSMISPVSILMAMAMAENGTAAGSRTQIEKAFGCTAEELSDWLKNWMTSLKTGRNTRMNVANSFWFRDTAGLEIKESYIKDIKTYFNASAYKESFDTATKDAINNWCDENTYGMIKKVIQEISPEDMAIIVNATAFEGAWLVPYEEHQVEEGETFYTEYGSEENADMLYSEEGFYIEGKIGDKTVTGFKKSYEDGYSFVALLPEEGTAVADCVKDLDGSTFASLLNNGRYEKVNTVIPEFTSEYTVNNLISTFEKMGIKDIFSPDMADLSNMATAAAPGGDAAYNLYISKILHKTFIEVNRKGTRAAAVTEMVAGCTSMPRPEEIHTVRLDRPFIYAIIDDVTATPIFIGTVMSVAEGK